MSETFVVTPGTCPHCGNTGADPEPSFFDNVEDEFAYCYGCKQHSRNPRWNRDSRIAGETRRIQAPLEVLREEFALMREAYDLSDPKHPDHHSVHVDIHDMREGK